MFLHFYKIHKKMIFTSMFLNSPTPLVLNSIYRFSHCAVYSFTASNPNKATDDGVHPVSSLSTPEHQPTDLSCQQASTPKSQRHGIGLLVASSILYRMRPNLICIKCVQGGAKIEYLYSTSVHHCSAYMF